MSFYERVIEIKEMIRSMLELGWGLDVMEITDKDGEPLRVTLGFRFDRGTGNGVT